MNWKRKKIILEIERYGREIVYILLGASFMAFGTSMFLLPNQLSSGGFAGIATILYYLLEIPMGVTISILNVPLCIFTFYKLGRASFVRTIIGSFSYSFFLDIFDRWLPLTEDRFLACIYGGILVGLGTAFVLKGRGTTGGTELIANLIKEYRPKVKTSHMIVIIDVIIVLANILLLREFEIGLYSAIAIYLMGKIIDIVFEGTNFTKLLFIISDKNEEIAKAVGYLLKRGTTGLLGKGMYTKDRKLVLLCAAGRRDFLRVRQIAQEIDPKAFIIISNAREVYGKGFKDELIKK